MNKTELLERSVGTSNKMKVKSLVKYDAFTYLIEYSNGKKEIKSILDPRQMKEVAQAAQEIEKDEKDLASEMKADASKTSAFDKFLMSINKKIRRRQAAIALMAALSATVTAGCAPKEPQVIVTQAPNTPKPTLKPTPNITPIPTPSPTATPIPTPTIDPLGLNSCDDIYNDEIVEHELERMGQQFLTTTFITADWATDINENGINRNWMLWRGVPDGKIDIEFLRNTMNEITGWENFEYLSFTKIVGRNQKLENPIILSLEPLFINGSDAEKVYQGIYEKKLSLYNAVGTPNKEAIAEEVAYYIYNDFVLEDKIFEESLENADAYDKLLIINQLFYLFNLVDLFIPEFVPIVNGQKVDQLEYLRSLVHKLIEYSDRFERETFDNSMAMKRALN